MKNLTKDNWSVNLLSIGSFPEQPITLSCSGKMDDSCGWFLHE